MSSPALQIPLPEKFENNQGLPDETKQEYGRILALYSSDTLDATEWHISLTIANRTGNICFPKATKTIESDITRVTAIIMLTSGASIATCQRRVHDFDTIFNFFHSESIELPCLTQDAVNHFIQYLDGSSFDNWKRNQYMQSMQALIENCMAFEVIPRTTTIEAMYRFDSQVEPKRAPDTITVNQLDSLFFDKAVDISLGYRAIYILLRLHTHRISEVLATPLDCISYPADDVFAITIPNSKETPYHIPNYQKYNFLLSGFCGSFCHDIVHDQQQYALSQQSNLPDNLKEYLFVSQKGQRLITTRDFNSYLSEFCARYNIINASGNPTKVTSHDFRHIAVCERFKSDIISPERTSVECNHASVDDTMGYGYYSKHDEAKHLAQIVSPILPLDSNEQSAPRFVPARKYEILAKQPTTRVIPYYGLCLDRKCSPQFERCFHCDLFIPDPQYREYIAAAIKRLQEANELIARKHGNDTIRQQNLKDIQTFNAYLEKMDATKKHQKES